MACFWLRPATLKSTRSVPLCLPPPNCSATSSRRSALSALPVQMSTSARSTDFTSASRVPPDSASGAIAPGDPRAARRVEQLVEVADELLHVDVAADVHGARPADGLLSLRAHVAQPAARIEAEPAERRAAAALAGRAGQALGERAVERVGAPGEPQVALAPVGHRAGLERRAAGAHGQVEVELRPGRPSWRRCRTARSGASTRAPGRPGRPWRRGPSSGPDGRCAPPAGWRTSGAAGRRPPRRSAPSRPRRSRRRRARAAAGGAAGRALRRAGDTRGERTIAPCAARRLQPRRSRPGRRLPRRVAGPRRGAGAPCPASCGACSSAGAITPERHDGWRARLGRRRAHPPPAARRSPRRARRGAVEHARDRGRRPPHADARPGAVPDRAAQPRRGGPLARCWRSGARVTFPGSELVWQHYAGPGPAAAVAGHVRAGQRPLHGTGLRRAPARAARRGRAAGHRARRRAGLGVRSSASTAAGRRG